MAATPQACAQEAAAVPATPDWAPRRAGSEEDRRHEAVRSMARPHRLSRGSESTDIDLPQAKPEPEGHIESRSSSGGRPRYQSRHTSLLHAGQRAGQLLASAAPSHLQSCMHAQVHGSADRLHVCVQSCLQLRGLALVSCPGTSQPHHPHQACSGPARQAQLPVSPAATRFLAYGVVRP